MLTAIEWISLTAGPTIGGALGWLVGDRYGRWRRAQLERDTAAIRAADRRLRLSVDSGRPFSRVKTECGHHFTRLADGAVVKCCLEVGHECAHAWWSR